MEMNEADKGFLADQIRSGNVVLFLGAGANHGSRNGKGHDIKLASGLEAHLRTLLRVTEKDVTLSDLVEEYREHHGDRGLRELLAGEFSDCTPSEDLKNLFSYSWFRIYTLNIDDAVEHVPRARRQQQFIQKNRNDQIGERRNFDAVEIVHLNGFVNNQEQGFIFTEEQYRKEIMRSAKWYQKCAEDSYEKIFLFLGTKLEEPIFFAHIEDISRETGDFASRSFLITPTLPGSIRQKSLKKRKIDCIAGSLSSFVRFLQDHVGEHLTPGEVAARIANAPAVKDVPSAVVTSVAKIGTPDWLQTMRAPEGLRRRLARDFFNGFPPTWNLLCNRITVALAHDKFVLESIRKFLASDARIFTLIGQAGSGKTTTLMKAALELASTDRLPVYVLDDLTQEKISNIVSYVARAENRAAIIYIDNLVLFADDLNLLDQALRETSVKVISQCRSSDMGARVQRVAPNDMAICDLPRLVPGDYEKLLDGLIEHAVAPAFLSLKDRTKQIEFLRRAQQQLLMLMKQATGQRKFEETIEDEFRRVESPAAQATFCLVGLATLGKSRLTVGELRTILNEVSKSFSETEVSFDVADALNHLEGMIHHSKDGSIVGRHEIYVRHIFDFMIGPQLLKDCIVAFLKYFTRFGQPVITNLGRQKGNLFKFLLNSDFLFSAFQKKKTLVMAERVYSSIEREYQLDGHYWLQRGLFYRRYRKHEVALDCFGKSIDAFPGNLYARHALAQQRLINAALTRTPTRTVENEVTEAVAELNRQIGLRDVTDDYPLITLATFHPEVLVQWGNIVGARKVAQEYFERLEVFSKSLWRVDPAVDSTRKNCLLLATTGMWRKPTY